MRTVAIAQMLPEALEAAARPVQPAHAARVTVVQPARVTVVQAARVTVVQADRPARADQGVKAARERARGRKC